MSEEGVAPLLTLSLLLLGTLAKSHSFLIHLFPPRGIAMTNGTPEDHRTFLRQIEDAKPDIAKMFEKQEVAAALLARLPTDFPADKLTERDIRIWELCGLVFRQRQQLHQALAVFIGLYQHMHEAQRLSSSRWHKGMPLCWISDCFGDLGFDLHSKRYLLLTLCEDAVTGEGQIDLDTTGVYWRLVWRHGFTDAQVRRLGQELHQLSKTYPQDSQFPEALLQEIPDSWLTEFPSPKEALRYIANPAYVRFRMEQLGGGSGIALEQLAHYLMSCMPGCRARRRVKSRTGEFDVVCSMEGFDVDFRSEFGRLFVCECKDWASPADFSAMAKFCRVLDSTKARFGILFSKMGITGTKHDEDATREQLKIFQDRGLVIVVIDIKDLTAIAQGDDLIAMLRSKYEAVRLDLRSGTALNR
jgi:hypothetical protein